MADCQNQSLTQHIPNNLYLKNIIYCGPVRLELRSEECTN